jgi:hypothetical protein
MTKHVEFIAADKSLKARLGKIALSEKAASRAQEAMDSVSGRFDGWLNAEMETFDEIRAEIELHGLSDMSVRVLTAKVHDLVGLGATCGYPLVTRLAQSLGRLLQDPERRLSAPMFLVDAHTRAIKAAVRDTVRDCDHPTGKVLLAQLEGLVDAYLAQRAAA